MNEIIYLIQKGRRRAWYFRLRAVIRRKLSKEYLTAYLRYLRGKATREDYVYVLYDLQVKTTIKTIKWFLGKF